MSAIYALKFRFDKSRMMEWRSKILNKGALIPIEYGWPDSVGIVVISSKVLIVDLHWASKNTTSLTLAVGLKQPTPTQ